MPDIRIIVLDSSAALMPAALALRHEVFVIEQQVPAELERDEHDAGATHVVALYGDEVAGTLRILVSGSSARIGRMAVSATMRKRGVGSRLMTAAETVAVQMGVRDIVLHAQLTARTFYGRLGYREQGAVFEEAGIQHVEMHKALA